MDPIEKLLDNVAEVCPLPKTADKVLTLTSSDRASIPEVARVIVTDPALAAAVLRIANSAIYGGGAVDRIEPAVMRIGMRGLHDMAAAMSLFAAFRNRGEHQINFHDQSVVAGAVAHRMAKTMGGTQPSVAFTGGLLSEIGAMACLAVDGKTYSQIRQSTLGAADERRRLERERYGASSQQIGGRFLARHRLPQPLCDAVAVEYDADFATIEPLARYVALGRVAAEIVLRGNHAGDPQKTSELLGALPETLRGADLDGPQLFEICLQAGATAEQALRTGR